MDHACEVCGVTYSTHGLLLEHLYWRHGTESQGCPECGLRQWAHAAHVCHALPCADVPAAQEQRESPWCLCGRDVAGADMIACDAVACALEWFHFQCVGVTEAPLGQWFCPTCLPKEKKKESMTCARTRPFTFVIGKKQK